MKKGILFTFFLGVITGGILTILITGQSPLVNNEATSVSKSGPDKPSREFLEGEMLDIPGETQSTGENKGHEVEESLSYDMIDDSERVPTQLESFERSVASEPESQSPEDMPTTVPDEAPPEHPEQTEQSE